MTMKKYSDALSGCSTTVLGVHRAADIVAALTPPPDSGAPAPAKPEPVAGKVVRFVPGLVGAGIGATVWREHRVLGALSGYAAVNAGYAYTQGQKKKAVCQLVVEGSGVAGALMWKKRPVLGWLSGIAAGAAATYFVKGSPVRDLVKKGMK